MGRSEDYTFVRRRLHSLQAVEALLILLSSVAGPGVPLSGVNVVRGARARSGLAPCCGIIDSVQLEFLVLQALE